MPDTKRQVIYKQLAERICSGEFVYGDSFLGVEQLRKEFSTSYVTACRVLRSLADDGYLLCRNRSQGYKVCYINSAEAGRSKKLNIIVSNSYGAFKSEFISLAMPRFQEAGWEVRVRLVAEQPRMDDLKEIINEPDAYSILINLTLRWSHFSATLEHLKNRVLIIGLILYDQEISTVICDEKESMIRVIRHFKEMGRCHPALIINDPQRGQDSLRISAWREFLIDEGYDFDWIESHIWQYCQSGFSSIGDFYHDLLSRYGREVDSVYLSIDPHEFIRQAEQTGLRVPEDICLAASMTKVEDRYLADHGFLYLYNNPLAHVETAFRIMEYRYQFQKRECGYAFFCHPGEIRTAGQESSGN